MARRKANTTKLEIIQVATQMFLEKGYTNTSAKAISDELDISTGNLTFYFPTKEHLLAEMIQMLCGFQWKMITQSTNEGNTSLLAVCLELMAMAAICEENEIMKDFYISAYTHPMTLEIIRKNDAERAKLVYEKYTSDWTEEDFLEAEILVSGIEYTTLMTTNDSLSLETRISGALNTIMMIYNVPEDVRQKKIEKVLAMDYRGMGQSILQEFTEYIREINEQALEELIKNNRRMRKTANLNSEVTV